MVGQLPRCSSFPQIHAARESKLPGGSQAEQGRGQPRSHAGARNSGLAEKKVSDDPIAVSRTGAEWSRTQR